MTTRLFVFVGLCFCQFVVGMAQNSPRGQAHREQTILAQDNLVAWCIVPFDAKKRGPAARAEMVQRLGLSKVAYDWRKKHIAEFEQEILEYKKRNIEFFAFWSWHDSIAPLIKKHRIQPQIWITVPSPDANTDTQADQVKAASEQLSDIVERTRSLGLKLGLYNHGGWGGEPVNMAAVCSYLRREKKAAHVGIVYNFHHGHGHIDDFAESLQQIQPYLLCINLNGMADPEKVDTNLHQHKIKPIGSGVHESKMLRVLLNSSYKGPVGVLGHRADVDAEVAVRANLEGLDSEWKKLQSGGERNSAAP